MNILTLASTSRAQDAGFLALADLAALAAELAVDYRIIGGHMVSIHVAMSGLRTVPDRETADVDLAVEPMVVADPALLSALETRGYTTFRAANRFERETDGLWLAVDVLTASYSGRLRSNQRHGGLVVDEIPGLSFALARPPVEARLAVRLTSGVEKRFSVVVPDLVAALCLKALAYHDRLAEKDAFDLWRLLEVSFATGLVAEDWPTSVTARTAAQILATNLGTRLSLEQPSIVSAGGTPARFRALVNRVVGVPR